VEWIKASLVKQDSHPSLFGDDPVVKTTIRKSFFRRLAEAKGSPAIDHEDVIIVRKPAGGDGVVACVVSSPPYEGSFNGNQSIPEDTADAMRRRGATEEAIAKACTPGSHTQGLGYGHSPGQLGSMKPGSIEDAIDEKKCKDFPD